MNNANAKNAILTEYAKELIRFKARELCRHPGFSPSEQEDLEQDFWLALASHEDGLDLRRASRDTFSDRVVSSTAAMARRARRRRKRVGDLNIRSLDTVVAGTCNEAGPLADSLKQDDLDRRTGNESWKEAVRRDEAQAVDCALEKTPEDVRHICRLVMGGSISSAARDLGTSRRQVRKALVAARPYLKQAGFGR